MVSEKTAKNVDAGLNKLCSQQKLGETATLQEIADACKCSNTYIMAIQKSALKKIRDNCARDKLHPLREFFEN